jgi:aminoglycoside phosphotransferase (APT) family kinase protein
LPVEFRPCIEAASQFLLETYPAVPKLCHGDINSGNVLVSGGHLTALIDWFDLCGCDPAFDVAIFHFWESDEQILSALLEAYTPEEPILFRRRIAANVICYAAYLLTTDWKPTMDKTPAHRQCLKWLAEGESMAF